MAGSTPWNDLYLVGKGVDSQIFKTYNQALEYDDPVAEDPGQRTFFNLFSLTTTHDLMQNLNVSAAASIPSLGAFSGSAEFELSKNTEMHSFYTYGLVRVTVLNPPQVIRNLRLNTDAKNLLQARGWDAFAESYGREYIAGKVTGGTFYGMIECQTTNVKEQQDIRAEISASYGPFSAEGKVTSKLTEMMSRIVVNTTVYRSGGSNSIPMDFGQMLEEARKYPETVKTSPVTISALVNDYKSSVLMPDVPADNSLAVIQKRDTLNDLGREYLRLRERKSTLDFILGRNLAEFDEYADLDENSLIEKKRVFRKHLEDVGNELDVIKNAALRCEADIRECKTYVSGIENLELPTIGGELLNIRQIEEELRTLRLAMEKRNLLSDGPVRFDKGCAIGGDATVGAGGNGLIKARHIEGKSGWDDGDDPLFLNWYSGRDVHVGDPARPSNLIAHGDVGSGRDVSVGRDVRVGQDMRVNRYIDAWDVRAGGGLYVFKMINGQISNEIVFTAQNSGHVEAKGAKLFSIDHPLRPQDAQLKHACIEGPEIGVYYRGESSTDDNGCAKVTLPDYFEALTRREGRTVLVTPILSDSGTTTSLSASRVINGGFVVRTSDGACKKQEFYWEVKAVRADVDILETEVEKDN